MQEDIAHLPGVYIHPGKFKEFEAKQRNQEAWERYWNRFKRARSHLEEKNYPGRLYSNGQRW